MTVNATEVARNFSEVLDGVEHRHQTYLVTRGGRPVARITPVPRRQRDRGQAAPAGPRRRPRLGGGAGGAASRPGRRGAGLDRLILDTTVLVAGEPGLLRLDELIGDEDDVAIAAITVAELLVGVELADAAHRPRRRALVESVVAAVPVEDYDLDVARAHARLLAHARRPGRRRGAHDLVIAATALARDRTVVTADRDGFGDLPGVGVRLAGSAAGG